LRIIARLVSSDLTHTGWQRDLVVIYSRVAAIYEKTSQADAMTWWRKAYDRLSAMKQRGVMQSRDEAYLAQLKRKVGA
jgi:hypothetical protein